MKRERFRPRRTLDRSRDRLRGRLRDELERKVAPASVEGTESFTQHDVNRVLATIVG